MAGDGDIELRVTGADQLYVLSRRLKATGETGLKKDLNKRIRDAAKPAKQDAKASALANLPRKGGLAALIAKSRVSVSIKTGAKTVGVTIKASNAHSVGSMDRGVLKHPVFGDKGRWVSQSIGPGWFSDPIKARQSEYQRAVLQAMEDTQAALSNKP